MNIWAVVPAAGSGSRFGHDIPKQFLTIGHQTVLEHSISVLISHPLVSGVVVALSADHLDIELSVDTHKPLLRCIGGKERMHSVHAALQAISDQKPDYVLVHDAARPCLPVADLDRVITVMTGESDGAILAMPVRDTLKKADQNGHILHTVDRDTLWQAQTPQAFPYSDLMQAINMAMNDKLTAYTDEASCVEALGKRPRLVPGSMKNLKITHPEDLEIAGIFMEDRS